MAKIIHSVVLPTYNEAASIRELLVAITSVLRHSAYEILVIDDHSPDNTAAVVQDVARTHTAVHCVTTPRRLGLAASVLLGIKRAKGTIIIGMDADFNHNPRDIPALLSAIRKPATLAVASRFIPGGGMEDGFRYWSSKLFNLLIRLLFRFPIWDNTSGYYAIRKSDLLSLNPGYIYRGYGEYHLRLVMAAQSHGMTIREIPTVYSRRMGGTSKSNLLRMFREYLAVAAAEAKRTL